MAFENMGSRTTACRCGEGTVTMTMEMDDWNRVNYSRKIDCARCNREDSIARGAHLREEMYRRLNHNKAKALAEERYLQQWLERYKNCNIKAAWRLYTGERGYPRLGTFYKHVKDLGGVTAYLRWHFQYQFQRALELMGVHDEEIAELLRSH